MLAFALSFSLFEADVDRWISFPPAWLKEFNAKTLYWDDSVRSLYPLIDPGTVSVPSISVFELDISLSAFDDEVLNPIHSSSVKTTILP